MTFSVPTSVSCAKKDEPRAVCNCVYGTVARVVYSRTFPGLIKPQTERLNKSPPTVHAIANRPRHKWLDGEAIYHRDPFAVEGIEAREGCDGLVEGDALSDQFLYRQFSGGDQVENLRIGMSLYAVAADYLKFMRDDFSHRERGV